ncbi:MAG: hypothetical protein EU530_02775 [Promethearchaeota archaeon]|nr:MAG: hypothetical protein EU530_02775 [Candidatus Lokiarchaeota archaeon]
MLKTLLRYIFLDCGTSKMRSLGYYNYKNAKDMSEECVTFTRKLMGYMKTQDFKPEIGFF